MENAAFLLDMGESLSSACQHLGLKPDSLYAACRRAGKPEIYEMLSEREPDAETRAKIRAAKA